MWKRFKCCALLVIFSLFSLENSSFWVCGDDDLVAGIAPSRNGKRQSMIPLRDNADYDQSEKDDYEYNDEYETFDGDQFTGVTDDKDVEHKILLKANDDVPDERVVDATKTQTETSSAAVSSTSAIGTTSIEMCPKECSCLNDFMDCVRMNLDRLPYVPEWVTSL